MALRLSRRKISVYFADEFIKGNKEIAQQLAGFLVETRRTDELELIVRDIETALGDRGVVVADVDSARELSSEAKKSVASFLKESRSAKTIHLRENVDQTLLGGARITTAGFELDATLRRKLTALKAHKV
ncbi:MAG: F0F1 ATP synthase subunit delta [Candidatus Saccharibacteria bacterium]